jgi:uncharacterized YccA/Bax inhibitor family protein
MSNPLLSTDAWSSATISQTQAARSMTVQGTAHKAALLLGILLVSLSWMWGTFWNHGNPSQAAVGPWMIGGAIGSLVAGLAAAFLPRWSMPLGLLLAVCKGLFLGGLTMYMQATYPGLPLLAAVFTVATLAVTLFAYATRIVRVSQGFVMGVAVATGALFIGVAGLAVLGMFGIGGGISAALHGNGMIGIGFSVVCVVLATFALLADFHVIEEGARGRAPAYMEWAGALALVVTLAWLYIEILRLLAKLRSND